MARQKCCFSTSLTLSVPMISLTRSEIYYCVQNATDEWKSFYNFDVNAVLLDGASFLKKKLQNLTMGHAATLPQRLLYTATNRQQRKSMLALSWQQLAFR